MSGILTPILMLGMLAGGIYLMIHRCDILGFCGGGATSGAVAPVVAPVTASPATDNDNGKSSTCGCCTCTQSSKTLTTCTTPGGGSIDFTGGILLADQCQACANDANICKNAKKEQKRVDTTNKAAKDALDNLAKVSLKAVPGKAAPVICGPGFHTNSKGTCVPNGQTLKKDEKASGDGSGCRTNEVRICENVSAGTAQIICKCAKSNNFRTYYAEQPNKQYGTPYRVFRNRISFN